MARGSGYNPFAVGRVYTRMKLNKTYIIASLLLLLSAETPVRAETAKNAPAGAPAVAPAPVFAPAPVEQSKYRLIGTMEGKSFSGAVFDDGTGAQTFMRLNDKIADGSQIVGIYDDHIDLKRPDGSKFEMYTIHETAKSGSPSKAPVVSSASAPAASEYRPPAVSSAMPPSRPQGGRAGGGGIDARKAADRGDRGEGRVKGRRGREAGSDGAATPGANPRGASRSRNRTQQ